jgi:putative membrane-bound dehydrogenase-like protein
MKRYAIRLGAVVVVVSSVFSAAAADREVIPHAQTKPPGPALSPQEALKKMVVPEGFSVELVAAEPDIQNPVAMTFDEKGRIWITESFEYPRSEPGPGRDRVKVLEDTDRDGEVDKVTIFAEGLNIPSGIAVGHGGVWVANSPDILFLQDTDGDLKADKSEVVVTGFGRTDTHELPNSLTWGPDGWLYGLNGVFNHSHVTHKGKEYQFTCALFRIHPKTHDFELFAEGTSNPWGIAWDPEGSAFLSACVIDHLWHLTESGYYHRQGGPYPPFTWKIDSIVDHKHQMAAYCGIHYFDSDAYPPRFRDRLYMGNIHGNCINSDKLQRAGSTYFATGEPDFLTANDAWFMPVVQKTGPDGCLYVLDWYDRYHCYQDARRDPAGIDRGRGRLYRVRYQDGPRAPQFDLATESDEQLIERLYSGNVYFRDIAQRLLTERDSDGARSELEQLVLSDAPRKTRLHALWSLVGTGRLDADFHRQLLSHADAGWRAWGVRAAGNFRKIDDALRARVIEMAGDESPDVQLQVAIAARKIDGVDPLPVLVEVLARCGEDELIPHIVWQNLHPLLEEQDGRFVELITQRDVIDRPGVTRMMPLAVDRILAVKNADPAAVARLLVSLIGEKAPNNTAASRCLRLLAERIGDREISGDQLVALRVSLASSLGPIIARGGDNPLAIDAALAAASWGDADAQKVLRAVALSGKDHGVRLAALESLIAGGDKQALELSLRLLTAKENGSAELQAGVLGVLGRLDDPRVGAEVAKSYVRLPADQRPKAIELLTQRPAWSKDLLAEIGKGTVPVDALNANQVRKLLDSGDAELIAAVQRHWGTIRAERDPQREEVLAKMRQVLRNTAGDPHRGREAFMKVCGQCHKIYGQGQEVGPDITSNGRGNFEQLLSNVFDPSLVIGAAYQAHTVITADGRVLTGLLVEDSPQRVVLKTQGGKLETVPRENVEESRASKLSLMPEGVENQLMPQELADLFAFLVLDRPPEDPEAKPIPAK